LEILRPDRNAVNLEGTMDRIFTEVQVGKKNMAFGITLFLLFGVLGGIPLTINFFGGSVLSADQYQTWKVVHGYGIFLGLINYFFGLMIDRLHLTRQQKQVSSWSFLIAGLFGAVARMTLVLFSALSVYGVFASLGETVFITLGMTVFVLGQLRGGAFPEMRPRTKGFALRGGGGTP
jgi:hypothetical protein